MAVGGPRLAVPLAAALLGFLGVVAASQPQGPLRETRRLELVDLIRAEDARVERLRAQVGGLEEAVEALGTTDLGPIRRRLEALEASAGSAGLRGRGIVVRLDDSKAARSPTGDPNDLLVHERDIQTVVNALWAGGAEAVAVNGQRLTALSAVRCAGNTLLLHGRVYPPPYVVSAIGDPQGLASGLAGQPGFGRLLQAADIFGIEVSVGSGTVTIAGGTTPQVGWASPVGGAA